jgi:WD40 repeat protein
MLRVWDVGSGEEVFAYPAPLGRPSATPDGLVLVPALGTPTAHLIDTGLRAELGAVSIKCGPAGKPLDLRGDYVAVGTFCDDTSTTTLFDANTLATQLPAGLDDLDPVQTFFGSYDGMALSPDGTRLARQTASGAGDDLLVGPVEIMDLVSGRRLELEGLCAYRRNLERHVHVPADNEGCSAFPSQPFPILGSEVHWSPDGNLIAIVDGLDGYFAVWNTHDGRLIPQSLSANRPDSGTYGAFDVAFSSDSRHLFVSHTADRRTAPGVLDSVSTATWTIDRSSQPLQPGLRLKLAGSSSDGSTVLGASGFRGISERSLFWFDAETLEEAMPSRARLHEGSLFAVAMSGDRSLLATGSSDGFVRVWDSATGRLDHELSFGAVQVDGLAFVADRRLGVVLGDETLRLVTTDSSELLDLVRSTLTRGFTVAECERFNFEVCPTLEELRGPATIPPPGATASLAPTATAVADPELEGLWESARLTRGTIAATLAAAGLDPGAADDIADNEGFEDYLVYRVEIRDGDWTISVFPDGEPAGVGWQGTFEVIEPGTVTAVERWCRITYDYQVSGDEMIVDLIDDPCYPGSDDVLFQTVIFESGPFTRIE